MLTRRIIPCLDVRAGRVVKGVRFADLRDQGDPAERAALYESQGADELVLLDVTATLEGRGAMQTCVRAVRAVLGIPLTVGGGVRSVDDAARLFDAGADKVSLNTAAHEDPHLVDALAARFGSQSVVVSVDAVTDDARWVLAVRSGEQATARDAVDWARIVACRGAGELLLTSWDRDGTRAGYDLPLIRAVTAAVDVPVIASGGADRAEHLGEAFAAGAHAALAASLFHDGSSTVRAVKQALQPLGLGLRPC